MKNEEFDITPGNYLIRTITHYFICEIVAVSDKLIKTRKNVWIGQLGDDDKTGRWSHVFSKGVPNGGRYEAYTNESFIERGAIIDYTVWPHDIPSKSVGR